MSGVCPMRVERFHGPVWGCWCGRDRWLGWACPVREWYGCAFGFPGRHPTVLDCGAVPMPMRGARGTPSAGPAGARGAWRFENWIVDASKRNMVFLFAYRDFARLRSEFGFEIDRFVIILTVR